MPLPDLETVRRRGLIRADADLVEQWDELVAAADSAIAKWCLFPRPSASAHPTLERATYTEYYCGPECDGQSLRLGLRPVQALTEVAVDTDGLWTYTSIADLDDDVLLDDRAGVVLVRPSSTFVLGSGRRAIRVTCDAGYDVSAEGDLVEALALLCAHWVSVGREGTFAASANLAGASASYRETTWPPAVRELVAPFRLWEREGQSWRHG